VARDDRFRAGDRNTEGESRTPFQRDRDRILYSSAFRRLAGVTQVVHAGEGHAFHNRMTHSLKVAQFGRRVAERLVKTLDAEQAAEIDPDLVEAACLAHDLGHPPFGHIAERELNDRLLEAKVPDGYEGNAQSFRIVTRLAIRNSEFRGLNLTRATLNGLLKYPWGYEPGGEREKKWGHYVSEKEEFEFAHHPNPADGKRCPAAALMDWADDVTYAVHDVEDFYGARIVPLDRLLQGGEELDRFLESVTKPDRRGRRVLDPDRAKSVFAEIADLAPQEVKQPFSGTTAQRAALNSFGAVLITKYNTAVTFENGEIRIDPEARDEVRILKQVMHRYVFNNSALVGQQYGQRTIIARLWDVLFDAAQRNAATRDLIPVSYQELVTAIDRQDLDEHDDRRERARVVADLISQMAEHQAIGLFRRLTGVATGSILDTIVS
jgi:dGTPase